jgi:hypothetical protein
MKATKVIDLVALTLRIHEENKLIASHTTSQYDHM